MDKTKLSSFLVVRGKLTLIEAIEYVNNGALLVIKHVNNIVV